MADAGDYAVVVAETTWTACHYLSAVVGAIAIAGLLSLRITPHVDNSAHEYVFGSDVAKDTASALLQPSRVTQVATHTVTNTVSHPVIRTVTSTPDTNKIANAILRKIAPAMEQQMAYVQHQLQYQREQVMVIMVVSIVAGLLLGSILWNRFIYPYINDRKEQHDFEAGSRPGCTCASIVTSTPESISTVASTQTEESETPDSVVNQGDTVGDAEKDTLTVVSTLPEEPETPGSVINQEGAVGDAAKATKEPETQDDVINQKDAVGDAEKDTRTIPVEQLQGPLLPPGPIAGNNNTDFALLSHPHQNDSRDVIPDQPVRKRKEAFILKDIFTRYDVEGKSETEKLLIILRSYSDWLGEHFVQRFERIGDKKAGQEVKQGLDAIYFWITAEQGSEGVYRVKTDGTRRKRFDKKLHEHFQTVQTPTNLATLQIHKQEIQAMMSHLKNVKKNVADHRRLQEKLNAIERMAPSVLIYVFDKELQAHHKEVFEAVQQPERSTSSTQSPAATNKDVLMEKGDTTSEPKTRSNKTITQQRTQPTTKLSVEEMTMHERTSKDRSVDNHDTKASSLTFKDSVVGNASSKLHAKDEEDSSDNTTEKETDGLTRDAITNVSAQRKKLPVSSRKVAGPATESAKGDATGTKGVFAGIMRGLNERAT